MTFLLRKLEKKIWLDPQVNEEHGGLQADALNNFITKSNSLSVFVINKEDLVSDVLNVLVAITATRDVIKEVDYALFEPSILNDLSIKTSHDLGTTPDNEINKKHLNLINLNANQIVELAMSIIKNGSIKREASKRIGMTLSKAIDNGSISMDSLNPKISPHLGKYRSSK